MTIEERARIEEILDVIEIANNSSKVYKDELKRFVNFYNELVTYQHRLIQEIADDEDDEDEKLIAEVMEKVSKIIDTSGDFSGIIVIEKFNEEGDEA